MTSQRGTEMANDKVAATVHGFGPNPCQYCKVTGPFPHKEGCPASISGWPKAETWCCWMANHTAGADHVKMCSNYEGTGEHIWGKLTEDDPYRAASDAAFRAEYEGTSEESRRSYDWAPKPWELALAMGIVLFIIAIFWFVTTYYPM